MLWEALDLSRLILWALLPLIGQGKLRVEDHSDTFQLCSQNLRILHREALGLIPVSINFYTLEVHIILPLQKKIFFFNY